MQQIDLSKLIGQRIFVQFKPGVVMTLAGYVDDALDFMPDPHTQAPVQFDSYVFEIVERDGAPALVYPCPTNPAQKLRVCHLPHELVAFVTSVDNPPAEPEPEQVKEPGKTAEELANDASH